MSTSRTIADAANHLMSPAEFSRAVASRSIQRRIALRLRLLRWWLSVAASRALKRTLDIVGAALGLAILAPLLGLVALAIRCDSPGPVLFSQQRVGKRGVLFRMYKFRSMAVTAESDKAGLMKDNESRDGVLFKLREDPRVTRVGRLLRRYSIDELPQLVNVLRGDMAIVGPRPALPEEVRRYDFEASKRLQTKPGLTCIWQVSGRSDLSFEQQVNLDIAYLRGKSLLTDLRLIVRTIPAVFSGKGAY